MRVPFRSLWVALICLAPCAAHAGQGAWQVSGELVKACTITYSCGGNDRCNQLRLENRVTPQDIAELSATCNFAGGNAALEISSLNNGGLRETRDELPLNYSLSMVGTPGSDFADRSLNVPLRVGFRPQTAGQTVNGMLRLRLENRQSSLTAGRYADRITVTILPAP